MTKKIKILSIEDEPVITARLERFVRIYFADYDLHWNHEDNLEQAHQFLINKQPDIILLDLNLYGQDGFELLKKSVSYAAHTIIVSAYIEKAIDAYEMGVIDFVAKPFTRKRLFKAFDRVLTDQKSEFTKLKYLSFRAGQSTEVIDVKDILFIKAADKYADVITFGGEVKFHDKSLGALCKILPDYFVRVHKSFIVPMTNVLAVNSREGSRYDLTLRTGEQLPVGRTRVDHVRNLLESLN